MPNDEQSRIMAIKAALVGTTSTAGWSYIKVMANSSVQKAVQEALDATDKEAGEFLRIKAKAMQQGFTELFGSIEAAKSIDFTAQDDGFLGAELQIEQGNTDAN